MTETIHNPENQDYDQVFYETILGRPRSDTDVKDWTFVVEDIAKTVEQIENYPNAVVLGPIVELPMSLVATCLDPTSQYFSVVQIKY